MDNKRIFTDEELHYLRLLARQYPTVEAANAWQPAACGLADYLSDEVTGQPGQSMGAYWLQTRG